MKPEVNFFVHNKGLFFKQGIITSMIPSFCKLGVTRENIIVRMSTILVRSGFLIYPNPEY